MRHDKENLYLGYQRRAVIDRGGRLRPWKAGTSGEDASVWQDDSFEVYFAEADTQRSVHFGIAASGATYDGVWKWESGEKLDRKTPPVEETHEWDGEWEAAAKVDGQTFAAERKIPRKTLKAAGLDTNRLTVNVNRRGKLNERAFGVLKGGVFRWEYYPLAFLDPKLRPPRPENRVCR